MDAEGPGGIPPRTPARPSAPSPHSPDPPLPPVDGRGATAPVHGAPMVFRGLWELSADIGRPSLRVRSRHPRLRLLFAALLALGLLVGGAAPAFAHAQLTSTEPVGGTAV